MKVRLHGTLTEVIEATRRLLKVFEVGAVSQPYPNCGNSVLVRVYLEVRLDPVSSGQAACCPSRALP